MTYVDDSGKTMGNRKGRSALHERTESRLQLSLRLTVQRGRGLIQQQHRRIFEDRPGDRHTLFLAAVKNPNTTRFLILAHWGFQSTMSPGYTHPLKRTPRSPTTVSYPSGKLRIRSWI